MWGLKLDGIHKSKNSQLKSHILSAQNMGKKPISSKLNRANIIKHEPRSYSITINSFSYEKRSQSYLPLFKWCSDFMGIFVTP